MDVAVFSDIHANHAALQACFDYCVGKGITNFILLGDFVTDGPYPQKTMELLYMLRRYFVCGFVRGNREEYLLNYRKGGAEGWKPGSASGALLYTYENLTAKDLDFFASLPHYALWSRKGFPSFEYCHGSPASASEPLLKDRRPTRRALNGLRTNLLLHGHFHVQETCEYRGKRAVNPGSVGLPWFYGGRTQFCILHGDGRTWQEEYVQLSYDRASLLKEFEESGLMQKAPAWAAVTMHTIRTGRDLNEALLLRAMQLCKERRGDVRWPDIPEECWAQALRESRIDLYGRDISGKL